MSELCLYMDSTYHGVLGHTNVCLSCAKGLSVTTHDFNYDSHVIAMTSQCEHNDTTHMMQM